MDIEKQTAIYVGRRITVKRQLAHFWQFSDGLKGYKKQFIPALIGEAWIFSLENGSFFLSGDNAPKRLTSDDADSNKVEKWAAEDVVAVQSYNEEKTIAKLKRRQQPFDKAMEPLIGMYSSLQTGYERAAFIQAIQRKLLHRD